MCHIVTDAYSIRFREPVRLGQTSCQVVSFVVVLVVVSIYFLSFARPSFRNSTTTLTCYEFSRLVIFKTIVFRGGDCLVFPVFVLVTSMPRGLSAF